MDRPHRGVLQSSSGTRKQRNLGIPFLAVALLGTLALGVSLFVSNSDYQPRRAVRLHKSQLQDLPSSYILCSPPKHPSLHLGPSETVGSIYTGNENVPDSFVQCVAVENGLIADIGDEREVMARNCNRHKVPPHRNKPSSRGPKSYKAARLEKSRAHSKGSTHGGKQHCDIRRLRPGQTLFPGFQDAHGHVLDYGWSRSVANLVGADSVEEIIRRLEAHVAAHPDLFPATPTQTGRVVWLEGLGWDQTRWSPPVFPTAADLSKSPVLRHLPIALRRIDVHALWLSQKAVDLVVKGAKGFPARPQDDRTVHGGLVLRDETGNPTGILIDNAMNLAYQVIPKWTDAQRQTFLNSAAEGLLQAGITAVGDAATDLEAAAFYQRLDQRGQLPFRIYSMLACPPDERRCAHRIKQIRPAHATSRFTLRSVKLFNDGALGSWGSAMWDDYSDRSGEKGLLLIDEKELKPLVSYWLDQDWQVCTHAIGDRANTLTLDAYEAFLASHRDATDLRPRVEHAQLMKPTDIGRFSKIGVIASMQPTHCTSDMGYVESRIGAERAAHGAYAWRSLLEQNASLALGSDFPVELPNPLHGIYSAITRLNPDGNSPHGRGGWYPHERLSRRQALKGFTLDTSFAQFEEHLSGTISKGKRADFTLLDRNILDDKTVTPMMLRTAHVDATFIDGQVVNDGVAAAFKQSRELLRFAALAKNPARGLQHIMLSVADFGHMFELGLLAGFASALSLCAVLLGFWPGAGESYEKLSASALNARKPETAWMNMGHWTSQLHRPDAELDLPTACQNLADCLYDQAGITKGANILDVGCGSGDSVLMLHQKFEPAVLHAVTSLEAQARLAAARVEAVAGTKGHVKVWAEDINEWLERTEDSGDRVVYDFVLALDCAYHFRSRTDFVRLVSRRLKPGGVIAFVDLLSSWPPPKETEAVAHTPPWPKQAPKLLPWLQHRLNCLLLSVPTDRFWSVDRYTDELVRAGGFERGGVNVADITQDVFPGFARFLKHFSKGKEGWRGGNAGMRFTLGQFADIVARWSRGGDQGLVRCCVVIAKKSSDTERPK